MNTKFDTNYYNSEIAENKVNSNTHIYLDNKDYYESSTKHRKSKTSKNSNTYLRSKNNHATR